MLLVPDEQPGVGVARGGLDLGARHLQQLREARDVLQDSREHQQPSERRLSRGRSADGSAGFRHENARSKRAGESRADRAKRSTSPRAERPVSRTEFARDRAQRKSWTPRVTAATLTEMADLSSGAKIDTRSSSNSQYNARAAVRSRAVFRLFRKVAQTGAKGASLSASLRGSAMARPSRVCAA